MPQAALFESGEMHDAGTRAAKEAAEAALMHTERARLLHDGTSVDMQEVRRAQYQRHFGKLVAATNANKAFKCVARWAILGRCHF